MLRISLMPHLHPCRRGGDACSENTFLPHVKCISFIPFSFFIYTLRVTGTICNILHCKQTCSAVHVQNCATCASHCNYSAFLNGSVYSSDDNK